MNKNANELKSQQGQWNKFWNENINMFLLKDDAMNNNDCCQLNSYIEVLTFNTTECDHTWQ